MATDPPKPDAIRDNTLFESQTLASPVAFFGDMLVLSHGNELRAFDAVTMRQTDTWSVPHRHFCFVQDGTLVAIAFPPKSPETAIHRIAKKQLVTIAGPILPSGRPMVLPARNPDELYVAMGERIYLVRNGEVRVTLDHPYPGGANREQLISFGDGRLVGPNHGSGVRLVEPTRFVPYATPDRTVMHLAKGTRDRIWYSFSSAKVDWIARTLVLAPFDKPMNAEQTFDIAPSRIVHLASHGETAAALLITLDKKAVWSIAVFDEAGKQRWRADVPDDFSEPALNHGFVAIGEKRVVLASHDGKLLWWDARTGDRT